MPNDPLTQDDISIEAIQAVFEQAYMDVKFDEQSGILRINEEILTRAHLCESRERLTLLAVYQLKDDSQRIDRLELVNRINENYVMIRAGINDDDDLWFDYSVVLKGGITAKALVQTTRMFMNLVPKAVGECDEDGIIE